MLFSPNRAVSQPKKSRPRSDRVIADSWRGLYGSDPFSSICSSLGLSGLFEVL
jgi:hypothetical protein